MCSLFSVTLSAAEIVTLTISGSDLYALMSTGTWEAHFYNGSNSTTFYYDNYSLSDNGDLIICVASDTTYPEADIKNPVIQFNTNLVYDNVSSFSAKLGSVFTYYVRTSGSSTITLAKGLNDYSYGFLLSETNIELPISKPSADNGSFSLTFDDNNTIDYNLTKISSEFTPTSISGFMFELGHDENLDSGTYVGFAPNKFYAVIDSITLTILDDGTGGGSDGGSGGGSSSVTQQAILNQISEANKKLDDMQSSIEQGTQDIIDNQNQNTQDIIDNQDKNTQDIIDKEQDLWDDTYDPSDEEVSDMQDNISGITDDLKDKLGLFTFIDDTLSQFFDLLDPSQVSSTNLVFPAFSLTVQGETYNIWDQYDYDISSLKEVTGFKLLFDCLHFLSVSLVYWALIHYLQVVFKRIFASGGEES